MFRLAFIAALMMAVSPRSHQGSAADDGFVPLFNGKDLTGWVNVDCHPSTFYVKDGEIITTGQPTGYLRTEKQYENFELELEWMHENKTEVGNSGLFVWADPLPAVGTGYSRAIEVQVLVNLETASATSHGDVFAIRGATCTPDRPHPKGTMRCLPSERRCKGGGEWNHYKIVANDGAIKLHVNGKEVSGVSKCNPRKGYLALESERAVCHFRNIKIKELPSTNPKPEEIADVAKGHQLLFNGLDLAGWKTDKDAWTASSGHLFAKGTAPISTEKSYGPCELRFDWKRPAKSDGRIELELCGLEMAIDATGAESKWDAGVLGGSNATRTFGLPNSGKEFAKPGVMNRARITVDNKAAVIELNGEEVHRMKLPLLVLKNRPLTLKPAEGLDIMNVFVLGKAK